MTVYAVVTGFVAQFAMVDGIPNYIVTPNMDVTNGTTIIGVGVIPNLSATIPIGTDSKKSDEMIRETLAAALFAYNGWTIDPNDIYIPFSG